MELEIIFQNSDFAVINKPAGISVHGGPNVQGEVLTDFLVKKFPEMRGVGDEPKIRPGIVHRLDKNTSGVLIAAKTQEAFLALKEIFQKRLAQKTYLAICCGRFKNEKGVIDFPIGRMIKNPMKRGVETGGSKMVIRGVRAAVTGYLVLKRGEKFTLVELKPKTGRMHQLRVHLAAIHHPVACDSVYGGKNVCCPKGASRQLLHALSLSFSYPEGTQWKFEADPPEDFAEALSFI